MGKPNKNKRKSGRKDRGRCRDCGRGFVGMKPASCRDGACVGSKPDDARAPVAACDTVEIPPTPPCPVCTKPVHDHDTYVRLMITDRTGRQHPGRGHSGCVGAAKAYGKVVEKRKAFAVQ